MLNFTHINEHARAKAAITGDEYRLLNYLKVWGEYNQESPGWCDKSQAEIGEFIGITARGIRKMIQRLEGKGLAQKCGENGQCGVTEKWKKIEEQSSACEEQGSADVGTKFRTERNKVPLNEEQSSAQIKELNKYKNNTLSLKEPTEKTEPENKKIETATEAESLIFSWQNSAGAATIQHWYERSKKRFSQPDFEQEVTKFCGHYLTTADEGKCQRFKREPLLFFQNGFPKWLADSEQFSRQQKPAGPSGTYTPQSGYRPLAKSQINHFSDSPRRAEERQAF